MIDVRIWVSKQPASLVWIQQEVLQHILVDFFLADRRPPPGRTGRSRRCRRPCRRGRLLPGMEFGRRRKRSGQSDACARWQLQPTDAEIPDWIPARGSSAGPRWEEIAHTRQLAPTTIGLSGKAAFRPIVAVLRGEENVVSQVYAWVIRPPANFALFLTEGLRNVSKNASNSRTV